MELLTELPESRIWKTVLRTLQVTGSQHIHIYLLHGNQCSAQGRRQSLRYDQPQAEPADDGQHVNKLRSEGRDGSVDQQEAGQNYPGAPPVCGVGLPPRHLCPPRRLQRRGNIQGEDIFDIFIYFL